MTTVPAAERRAWPASAGVALWLALGVPSTLPIVRVLGWAALAPYAIGAAIAVLWFARTSWPPRRFVVPLAIVTAIVLVAVFFVAYPHFNTHAPHAGSDSDDATDLGALALLHGTSPYAQFTYLGNPLHQFPGSFLIAIPFVLVYGSALQNPCLIAAFFLAAARESGDRRDALRLSWLVLVASPIVLENIVVGTEHVANAIYVTLGLWWLSRTPRTKTAALVWGVTLASRANFLALLPLACSQIARRRGWQTAAMAGAIALGTVAALTLPFYWIDPAHFGPFQGANRLTKFDAFIPHAGPAIAVVMGAVALACAARRLDGPRLFWSAAAVQAVPVAAGLVLTALEQHTFDTYYAAYATFAAWFVFLAIAGRKRAGA